MVSFSCEACGDVLTKKKLDPHRNQCRGASFTCLDCMVHFQGSEYRSHTSCISEAQKYQGALYRDKKANKGEKRKSLGANDDMVPKKAYVEDAPEDGENAVAVIDVPPRAPTPPPANEALPENVNVFDYLITEDTPTANKKTHAVQPADESKMLTDSQHSRLSTGNGTQFLGRGYSYGHAPVEPTFERYDSWTRFPAELHDSQASQQASQSMAPPAYLTKIVTPGPDRERKHGKDEKSDKKRKRQQVDDLDLSAMKPSSRDVPMTDAPSRILHTGLTGGLTRLVTDTSFYDDRIDAGPTPISPIKRSKRNGNEEDTQKRHSSYTTTKSSTSSRPPVDGSSRSRHSEHHEDRQGKSRRRRSPSSSSEDDKRPKRHTKVKAIDFQPHNSRNSSVQPSTSNQLVRYMTRAELFLSYMTKGPDSERGCSINKVLKRYHRERATKGEEKEEDDKELWKSLRLRENDRGEIVLFV